MICVFAICIVFAASQPQEISGIIQDLCHRKKNSRMGSKGNQRGGSEQCMVVGHGVSVSPSRVYHVHQCRRLVEVNF